jgi:predicted phosphodiesterase
MKAILSDIHGNLEALGAVLADIESRGITEIVCLGDVIGYGPNPRECLDLIRGADILVRGNHEDAVLSGDAASFNVRARRSVEWTREQVLGEGVPGEEAPAVEGASPREMSYRDLIAGFELSAKDPENEAVLYVHGSPRKPVREYVTPRDSMKPAKMKAVFELIQSICFVGHTHVPGVFTEEGYNAPDDLTGIYMDTGEKALVNVGSVGQPRDSDPRACYVTFDMDTVVYHRVEYDVEAVVAKVRSSTALDNSLGERLRVGR